jgi:hypothetical protein
VHRVPESTPTISASDSSRRVRGPADRSSSAARPGGHTERYSPPGPSLHTGSLHPILYISILVTLSSVRFSNRDPFDARPIGGTIGKTQTKTEQNPPLRRPFCVGPLTRTAARFYMGPMTQKYVGPRFHAQPSKARPRWYCPHSRTGHIARPLSRGYGIWGQPAACTIIAPVKPSCDREPSGQIVNSTRSRPS